MMSNEQKQNGPDGLFSKIYRPTLQGLASLVAGGLVAQLLNGDFPSNLPILYIAAVVLFIVAGTVLGLPIMQERLKGWYWIPAFYLVAVFVLVWLVSISSCPDCLHQGTSDEDTAIRIIKSEAKAVVNEDMGIIKAIFAKDAIVIDESNGKKWKRDARYTELFENAEFTEAEQSNFDCVETGSADGIMVWATGSSGRYKDKHRKNSDSVITYANAAGSNEWTLQKDDCGCWVIVKFRFNIGGGAM